MKFLKVFFILFVFLASQGVAWSSLIKEVIIHSDVTDYSEDEVVRMLNIKLGDLYSPSKIEKALIRLAELGRYKKVSSKFDDKSQTLEVNLKHHLA